MIKKKSKNILIGSIIIILIFLGVLFYYQSTGTGIGEGYQIIGRPTFGTLSCEPDENPTKRITQMSLPSSGRVFKATDFGDVSEVILSVNLPAQETFLGSYDTNYLFYRINKIGVGSITGYKSVRQDLSAITYTLPTITRGEEIEIYYRDCCLFGSNCIEFPTSSVSQSVGCLNQPIEGATVFGVAKPYVMWKQDLFNPTQKVSETCADPKSVASNNDLELITSTNIQGQTSQSSFKTRLAPEEKWSYISGFVLSPYKVETYNNQKAYCISSGGNGEMFAFSEIETINGNKYLIADTSKSLGFVDCCNDDIRLEKVCENHIWVSREKQECTEGDPLDQCQFPIFTLDPSDPYRKTIFREECVSGKCVKVTKQVECASSFACEEGFSCVNFECVETGSEIGGGIIPPTCGNGRCDAGENKDNCAIDCKPKEKCDPLLKVPIIGTTLIPSLNPLCLGTNGKIILGIFAFIIGLIVFAISLSLLRKYLPKKSDKPIVLIISILLGIGLAILTWFFFIVSLIILVIYLIITMIIKRLR